METASVQPAVLDYAPPPLAAPVVRRMRALMVILICIVVGGLAGQVFGPREFQATGYMHVATNPTSTLPPMSLGTVDKRQAEVAAAIMQLSAVVATLPPAVPPKAPLTATDLAARLNVRPMPNSRLVAVTFTDDDPRTAAAVVNAVMRGSRAPDIQIVAAATPPARPQRGVFFPLAGAAVGLLAGLFIVARRSK
jgi:hypothetical protein